jgi:hypothetical protein
LKLRINGQLITPNLLALGIRICALQMACIRYLSSYDLWNKLQSNETVG